MKSSKCATAVADSLACFKLLTHIGSPLLFAVQCACHKRTHVLRKALMKHLRQ